MHEHYPLLLGFIHFHPIARDTAMFLTGLSVFLYEALRGQDRPNIIYASMALMGVAAYLRGMAPPSPPKAPGG